MNHQHLLESVEELCHTAVLHKEFFWHKMRRTLSSVANTEREGRGGSRENAVLTLNTTRVKQSLSVILSLISFVCNERC